MTDTNKGERAETTEAAGRRLETVECSRCGGSGRMPFTVYNGVCFKCNGPGRIYTRKGRAAANYLEQLRSKPAGELVAGDKYLVRGFDAGSYSQPSYWVKVVAVALDAGTVKVVGTITNRDKSVEATTGEFNPASILRIAQTAEQKRATLVAALDYQDTLTAAGTVRKVKAARVEKTAAVEHCPAADLDPTDRIIDPASWMTSRTTSARLF